MGKAEMEYNGDRILENLSNVKSKMQMLKVPEEDKAKYYYDQILQTADKAMENIKLYAMDAPKDDISGDHKEMLHEFSNIYATLKGLIFLLKLISDEDDSRILSNLETEINQLIELIASTDLER